MRDLMGADAIMTATMNQRVQELLEQAKLLSDEERAELGHEILASVPAEQEEIDKAWAEESMRRLEDVRAGRAKTVSADAAVAEIRARAAARARPGVSRKPSAEGGGGVCVPTEA